MTLEDVEKKLTEMEGQLGAVTKRADQAEAIVALNMEDRQAYESLSKEDKQKFLEGNEDVSKSMIDTAKIAIAKAAEDTGDEDDDISKLDPVVQKRFEDLQKRLDTADARVAQAEKVAKASEDARQVVEFTKRAETEFGQLPGESVEKGKILKSLADKLTSEEFEQVTKLLKSGNECMVQLGKSTGSDTAPGAASAGTWDKIEKQAQALAKERKITFAKAVDQLMQEDPGLYNSYVEKGGK